MCFKCKTCHFDIFCSVSTISHKHKYVLKILKSIKETCETFSRSTEIYSEQGHFIALLCNLFTVLYIFVKFPNECENSSNSILRQKKSKY